MNSLIIKNLYIVSMMENKAKVIHFTDGINIITSDIEDGSDRGKSIIMKSIYHSLGADCEFKSNWTNLSKIYIIEISIQGNDFIVYRFDNFFKIFKKAGEDLILLFSTVHREKLAKYYFKLFGFKIELPNRDSKILEMAPPAYTFMLYYVDQDKMNGSTFSSFQSLYQFSNYKENLLYSHFGVFDNAYFELISSIDSLNLQKMSLMDNITSTENVIGRIDIDTNNCTFPQNIDALSVELQRSKDDYSKLSKSLVEQKNKLVELRSREYDVNASISAIKSVLRKKNDFITRNTANICPLCHSVISSDDDHDSHDIGEHIKKFNALEDYIIVSNELEKTNQAILTHITKAESDYKEKLSLLADFESKHKIKEKTINDIIKYKGLLDYREQLNRDYMAKKEEMKELAKQIRKLQKKKNEYDEQKKRVNGKYYELMSSAKREFLLGDVMDEDIQSISGNISGGGSNVSVVTIVWYMSLLRLKHIFNPDAISFPIVLDCPDNVEMDDAKRKQLFEYIFEKVSNKQAIISSLGFNTDAYPDTKFENYIFLTNEKLQLLNMDDFDTHKDYFIYLNSISAEDDEFDSEGN